MKILCATSMPYALEAFRTLGETTIVEGRDISPAHLKDVEVLALRSTTRVDEKLLAGSRVRFVGTATIGIDHMDIRYLEKAGIAWCYAAGCNANSVSEYLASALLCLARRHQFRLEGKTIGVVGVGNVGSRVVGKANALGLRVLPNDPPKQLQTADASFQPLERLLAESDILTMHISATVKKNAENAQQANQSAGSTRDVANRGGEVVAQAVNAMSRIEESSRMP